MSFSIAKTIGLLKRILGQRGVSAHDAEDLIQEAFHRLERYQRSNDVQHPEGFLVRTTVNLAIDADRKRRRANLADQPVESFVLVDESPRPDEVYACRKRLEKLNAGFAALDPITRQMVRAQRVEGLTVAEIAKRHGVSGSAVEKRLAKGLLFLTNWMKET